MRESSTKSWKSETGFPPSGGCTGKGRKRETGYYGFQDLVEKGRHTFEPVKTSADDPAFISYTSGTTGPPKGALHAHRVVLGHLPGIQFPHNFFPKEDDLFWTPADWAWMGGFMDVLLPSWHYGCPGCAHRAKKFDPEEAFHLLAKSGVRKTPLCLPLRSKMMRQVKDPRSRYDFSMRSIGSGGEALGEELLDWGKEVMRLTINQVTGQTRGQPGGGDLFRNTWKSGRVQWERPYRDISWRWWMICGNPVPVRFR